MERRAHIEVWCIAPEAGKHVEVLRYNIRGDADYVEWMREVWEHTGQRHLKELMASVEADGCVHFVEFDLVAKRPRHDSQWRRACWEQQHVSRFRGEPVADWIRKNILEAGAWW